MFELENSFIVLSTLNSLHRIWPTILSYFTLFTSFTCQRHGQKKLLNRQRHGLIFIVSDKDLSHLHPNFFILFKTLEHSLSLISKFKSSIFSPYNISSPKDHHHSSANSLSISFLTSINLFGSVTLILWPFTYLHIFFSR